MNRDQARGLLANLDILRHFAEGGDIGHRLINYKGELVRITPTDKLNLSGISSVSTYYVKVKVKLRWNSNLQCYERVRRCFTEAISENEVIPRSEA